MQLEAGQLNGHHLVGLSRRHNVHERRSDVASGDTSEFGVSVTATNGPAISLYLRCGFSVYGVDPEITCVNGVYYDELMMARRL